jgi:hypothetical protein
MRPQLLSRQFGKEATQAQHHQPQEKLIMERLRRQLLEPQEEQSKAQGRRYDSQSAALVRKGRLGARLRLDSLEWQLRRLLAQAQ